jgi:hypothetical protein
MTDTPMQDLALGPLTIAGKRKRRVNYAEADFSDSDLDEGSDNAPNQSEFQEGYDDADDLTYGSRKVGKFVASPPNHVADASKEADQRQTREEAAHCGHQAKGEKA